MIFNSKTWKRRRAYLLFVCVVMFLAISTKTVLPQIPSNSQTALDPKQQLGKSIFFDTNLSIERNQSCADCHGPKAGWTGPEEILNIHGAVYEGSIFTGFNDPPSATNRFGDRKPPSTAYATFSPVLQLTKSRGKLGFVGGNFWDGRATGEKLGNPAADQAQGPFLNPVEQALPNKACVVYRAINPAIPSDYPVSFRDVWGTEVYTVSWQSNRPPAKVGSSYVE